MIYRAIVEEVIDNYSAKIRIPLVHRTISSNNHTSYESLPVAKICTLPNTHPNIRKGDVVIVALENNDATKPLIIGYLYIDKEYETKISPNLYSLNVSADAQLSSSTSIGEVAPEDIKQLKGARENIQNQLDILFNRLEALEKYIQK
jgi:hypothetical protein